MSVDGTLFRGSPSDLGDAYQNRLLEQYKLYVQMADKISDRRQSANSFFLTVNTALIAYFGLVAPPIVASDTEATAATPLAWVLVVCAAGVILCFSWHQLVRSYRSLNSGKFKVIRAMESKLPSSPYDAEWDFLKEGKDSAIHRPFTRVERYVPWVFAALYAFLALWHLIQAA